MVPEFSKTVPVRFSRLCHAIASAITRVPNARIERAISLGRLALSVGGLATLGFLNSGPGEVLVGVYFAFSILMFITYREQGGIWILTTHIVETILVCLIIAQTEVRPASPYFVYFYVAASCWRS